MFRWTDRPMLVMLLLAMLAISGVLAQTPSPSPDPQVAGTGFISPLVCDKSSNSYQFTVQNAFGTQLNFTVVLQCDNAANTSLTISVSPFGQATHTISPVDQTPIANRICTLVLLGNNPTSGSPLNVPSIPSSCGVIDQNTYLNSICGGAADDDDWGDECGFNPFCHAETGSGTRSFVVLLIVLVFMFSIWGVAYISTFWVVLKNRKENLDTLAKLSSSDYSKMQAALIATNAHHTSLNSLHSAALPPTGGGGVTLGGGPARGGGYYSDEDDIDATEEDLLQQQQQYARGRSRNRSKGPPPVYGRRSFNNNNVPQLDEVVVVGGEPPTSALPYGNAKQRSMRSPPPLRDSGDLEIGREDEDNSHYYDQEVPLNQPAGKTFYLNKMNA